MMCIGGFYFGYRVVHIVSYVILVAGWSAMKVINPQNLIPHQLLPCYHGRVKVHHMVN